MGNLADKKCIPCEGGIPPMTETEIQSLQQELQGEWEVLESHHLEKTYTFKNFVEALAFTNNVGDLAESVGHHPDILLTWGKVKITIWTHTIDGLSETDFIFAAKCDVL